MIGKNKNNDKSATETENLNFSYGLSKPERFAPLIAENMSRLLAEVAGDDLELVRLRGEDIKTIYKRSNDLKESEGNHHYIHGALMKFRNKFNSLEFLMVSLNLFQVGGETVQTWYSQKSQKILSEKTTPDFEDMLKDDEFSVYSPSALMNESHFYNPEKNLLGTEF